MKLEIGSVVHGVLLLLAAACCSVALGCAKTTGGSVSSETHFLARCSDDDCGSGLSCVCGVCTEACKQDTSCTQHGESASCVASQDESCGTAKVCDVECTDASQCMSLGGRYACSDGRCRTLGSSAVDGGITPAACTVDDVVTELAHGTIVNGCSPEPRTGSMADCVRKWWTAQQPFFAYETHSGTDSLLGDGYFGVLEQGRLQVYVLDSDSFGFEVPGLESMPWNTRWIPCNNFSVKAGCAGGLECLSCDPRPKETCACTGYSPNQAMFVHTECLGGEDGACAADSCNIDGVCYPNGSNTEDGCCSCYDGKSDCIEPGSCPGWLSIGKRCDTDGECNLGSPSSGLQCRHEFAGGRGVCTRPCNYGCPTGYDCVAEVADDNGGVIHDMCMLPCGTGAECDELGSECDARGKLSTAYCF